MSRVLPGLCLAGVPRAALLSQRMRISQFTLQHPSAGVALIPTACAEALSTTQYSDSPLLSAVVLCTELPCLIGVLSTTLPFQIETCVSQDLLRGVHRRTLPKLLAKSVVRKRFRQPDVLEGGVQHPWVPQGASSWVPAFHAPSRLQQMTGLAFARDS